MLETNVFRPLGRCTKENFRGQLVRILLQQVMRDLPGVVIAKPVCQLDLVESILVKLTLGVGLPWTRDLELAENAELSHSFISLRENCAGLAQNNQSLQL